ncbi:MAG: hypothetical protein LBD22_03645, partial [Spirochaetaceae bacterium]|nr:hypothetical protein [Spirochaetaceae bacterium]
RAPSPRKGSTTVAGASRPLTQKRPCEAEPAQGIEAESPQPREAGRGLAADSPVCLPKAGGCAQIESGAFL